LLRTAQADRDDIWVSVENRIDSFAPSRNSSLVVPDAKHVIGLSNPVFHADKFSTVFATELGARGPSVYQIGRTTSLLLSGSSGRDDMPSYFEDIVYDLPTNQLFMTSKNGRAIFKMSAVPGAVPVEFLSTANTNKKPTGIAVDTCSRTIYWTNSDRKHPSIEVLDPDTGNSWTLVSSNLTRPRAVSVDIPDRKLYWTDSSRGVFWISRSNLDGTDREMVCKAKDHDPFSIVVTEEFIYWSDWTSHALWRTSKRDCHFQLIQKFKISKPHGVTFIPPTQPSCEGHEDILKPKVPSTSMQPTPVPTTTIQSSPEPGATPECREYCLGGECVQRSGRPHCDCYEGFAGDRCQIDMCYNFCLKDGKCVIVEDEPECVCKDGFEGDRCELETLPGGLRGEETEDNTTSESSHIPPLVYILGGTTGGLTLVVVVLSVLVHKMRLRPRVVRKRFISVAGSSKKSTDSNTASSSCGLPVEDGIQLDIENCCNMTLCDTPCFEPPTRGPKKSPRAKSSNGAQDKKSLLGDDDEDY